MIRTVESEVSTLEEDVRIVEVAGRALLKRIAERTERIADPVGQATERERARAAEARLNREVAIARAKIGQAKGHLGDAHDAALVQANSEDLAQLNDSVKSCQSIVERTQMLIASLKSVASSNQGMVAMSK